MGHVNPKWGLLLLVIYKIKEILLVVIINLTEELYLNMGFQILQVVDFLFLWKFIPDVFREFSLDYLIPYMLLLVSIDKISRWC